MNKVAAITIILLTFGCSDGYSPYAQTVAMQYTKGSTPLFIFAGQSQIDPNYSPLLQVAFIEEYERLNGVRPVVVNCAWGGTSIVSWQSGSYLMNRCADMVIAKLISKKFHVAGLAWSQGERDAEIWNTVFYPDQLRATLEEFRMYIPGLPIVTPQIGIHSESFALREHWVAIQEAQAEVVISMGGIIFETESFAVVEDDGIHNNGVTDWRIGEIIAGYFNEDFNIDVAGTDSDISSGEL